MNARSAYLDLTQRHRAAGLFTVEGFSNHLPMALGALLGLGAPAEALHRFAAGYAARLPPAPQRGLTPLNTAREARAAFGQSARYSDLLAYFSAEIERGGALRVQAEWLDELADSPASTAFHSLIRLAYGLRFEHPGEIASGLADLASQRCLLLPPESGALPIAKALLQLQVASALETRSWLQPPISQRLREVATAPEFRQACSPLQVVASGVQSALDALCTASIDEYGTGMSFTALHLVTSCHALRIVLPALADPAAALGAFWPAWAAAWVVARSTRKAGVGVDPQHADDWQDMAERALRSDDDHVIKMVFTCKEEHGRSGDPRYARAAARLLAIGHS